MIELRDSNVIIPAIASFWPILVTGKVVFRNIGETVCVGLKSEIEESVLVFVFPMGRFANVPSENRIAAVFDIEYEGRRWFDPTQLPISFQKMTAVTGFLPKTIVTDKGTIINIFFAVSRPEEDVNLADSIIVGKQFAVEPSETATWQLNPGPYFAYDETKRRYAKRGDDYKVLFVENYRHAGVNLTNVISILRRGIDVRLSENAIINASGLFPSNLDFGFSEAPAPEFLC